MAIFLNLRTLNTKNLLFSMFPCWDVKILSQRELEVTGGYLALKRQVVFIH